MSGGMQQDGPRVEQRSVAERVYHTSGGVQEARTDSKGKNVMDDHVNKVCILSIDGGGMRGIIPARVLDYLEEQIRKKSGDPEAKLVNYFDVAAGTSVGGIITTMLFTNDGRGRPLFSAKECWELIAEQGLEIFPIPSSRRKMAWKMLRLTPKYSSENLEHILKSRLLRNGRDLTLKDTLKPVLIPCYDLEKSGVFVFSSADALKSEEMNFRLWEVCRATSAVPTLFTPAVVSSLDDNCKTKLKAIDGGVVMNNPTNEAIAHVLRNKEEFRGIRGVEDLYVLSLGTGQLKESYESRFWGVRNWGILHWLIPIVKIVFNGMSNMVDYVVSMAFGEYRQNYLRIQVSDLPIRSFRELDDGSHNNVQQQKAEADKLFKQNSVEYIPFVGRKPVETTNEARLDWFADQLVKVQKARRALRENSTVN